MSLYVPRVAESILDISKLKISKKIIFLSPNSPFLGGHVAKLAILTWTKQGAFNRFMVKDLLNLQVQPLNHPESMQRPVRLLPIKQEVESEKVRFWYTTELQNTSIVISYEPSEVQTS